MSIDSIKRDYRALSTGISSDKRAKIADCREDIAKIPGSAKAEKLNVISRRLKAASIHSKQDTT